MIDSEEEKRLDAWTAMGSPEVWHREIVLKTSSEFVFVDLDEGYGIIRITIATDETATVERDKDIVICRNYIALGPYYGFDSVGLYKFIKEGKK